MLCFPSDEHQEQGVGAAQVRDVHVLSSQRADEAIRERRGVEGRVSGLDTQDTEVHILGGALPGAACESPGSGAEEHDKPAVRLVRHARGGLPDLLERESRDRAGHERFPGHKIPSRLTHRHARGTR